MADLKVGVIGCGGHARSHFAMIADEPRMELVAVAEIDPERLAAAQQSYQPQFAFNDYRQMLDQVELDVVYVVTMPGHLLPIVTECLGRNIHVSVEKSPGMTSEETRQMQQAEEASKARAIVSLNRRYKPEVLAARRLLQERGGAVQVAANYHKPISGLTDRINRGFAPAELICDAIHHVDLLRWLAGSGPTTAARPVAVHAQSWHGPRAGSPRYNAIIEFDNGNGNGCRGVMMSHYGVGYRIQSAEAHANDLSVYLELTRDPQVTVYEDNTLREAPLPIDDPDFNETRHFADCILDGKEPWSTLADVVQTMILCEAIVNGHHGQISV